MTELNEASSLFVSLQSKEHLRRHPSSIPVGSLALVWSKTYDTFITKSFLSALLIILYLITIRTAPSAALAPHPDYRQELFYSLIIFFFVLECDALNSGIALLAYCTLREVLFDQTTILLRYQVNIYNRDIVDFSDGNVSLFRCLTLQWRVRIFQERFYSVESFFFCWKQFWGKIFDP